MSVEDRFADLFSTSRRLEAIEKLVQELPTGGGGGTSGGVEPRIAKLEAQMDSVRSDLSRLANLPVDLATVKENVRHLPSKGFVVTATSTSIAVIGAIVIFADKLRALIAG